MHIALALQNHLISEIDNSVIGSIQEIQVGHVEIPSEMFWMQCRKALLSAEDVLFSNVNNSISLPLIIKLGVFRRPENWTSFGDAVINNTSVPAVMIRINGQLIPLAPRNAASIVIDFWANKIPDRKFEESLSHDVAIFVSLRLKHVFCGPFQLITHIKRLPYQFAAAFQSKQKFYFVIALDVKVLNVLSELERSVFELLSSGDEWALFRGQAHDAFRFSREDGSQPAASEIQILAVLSKVATQLSFIPLPETTVRVISLPDFVTLFDALDDVNELDDFWTYVDINRSTIMPMNGIIDLFASFRETHSVLVDGAVVPTMITLDTNWGSSWRYQELTKFWAIAPPNLPDDTLLWKIKSGYDEITHLESKVTPKLAWCTTVQHSLL